MVGVKQNTQVNTGTKSATDEIGKAGMVILLTFGVAVGIISLVALTAGLIKVGPIAFVAGAFGLL